MSWFKWCNCGCFYSERSDIFQFDQQYDDFLRLNDEIIYTILFG